MLIDWLAVSIVLYASFTVVFLAIAIIGLIELRDAFDFASLNSASWSSFAFFGASTLLSWSLDSYGWSPGKAVTGIRTVRLDGRRPGIVHGLVRYATRSIGLAALGLGYLWALWDERNQAWHDKLAGSVVVLAGPLAEQIGERRPRPLVVRRRVWWFAALSAVILCGSAALNVWIPTTFDEDFFESERFQPRQTDDGPRIHELETSEGDRLVVDLPARHLGRA